MKKTTVPRSTMQRSAAGGLVAASVLLPFAAGAAGDERGFLRDGDRWSIQGDSITANGGYVRAIRHVLNHFHPGAKIEINGIGVNGVPADHQFADSATPPTVVSIMLGTNDAIHRGYNKVDKPQVLEAYRQAILQKTKQHQAQGSVVLLLSSPLIDENYGRGWWELRNCNELIGEFPRILQEIAKETGAIYLPVQEEMAAYNEYLRRTFGIVRPLYPDGVHPNGWAQYPIAKVLWERLGVTGALAEKDQERRLSVPFKPVPVTASLTTKFLEAGAPLKVRFQAAAPIRVELNWSYGALRGKDTVAVSAEGTEWTIPLKPEELAVANGHNRTLVFDLAAGADRSLYLLDLTGTKVWQLDQDNAVGGDLPHDGTPKHGTWRMAKEAGGLLLTGTVRDSDIQGPTSNPTEGAGVQITLDLRQDARVFDLSYDEDVHVFCLNVVEKPRFGVGISPLFGRGISNAGKGGAQKTADGYAWNFFVRYGFKDQDKPFDVEKSEFIGFNIDIVDRNLGPDGKYTGNWIKFIESEYPIQTFPSFLHVLDMKHQLKGSHVEVLNLWESGY